MSGVERRELVCENAGGEKIWSLVWLPAGASGSSRSPVVVYAHGMHSNHLAGGAWARELTSKGYAVCCLDFRGGRNSLSDGEALDMTLFGEQSDVEVVAETVARQPWADANNMFLMGASMGGAASALAAAAKPGLVKGLVLLYPALSLADEVRRQFPDPVEIPESALLGERLPDAAERLDVVGEQFLRTLYGFDLPGTAVKYRGPVLIIHGTEDDLVEPSWSVRAARGYEHATLELVSGAGHGFSGGAFKFAVKKIVEFLDGECDLADESGLDGDLNFAGGGMGLGR